MANGRVIEMSEQTVHIAALDAVVAVDTGQWISTKGYDQGTIHIKGITTATVIINSSNEETRPTAATHDIQRLSVTADAEHILATLPRWIKVRISAWTSGTIDAFMLLRLSGQRR